MLWMATYQRTNSNKEDPFTNTTEQTMLDTLAYKFKCKWLNQTKKEEMWVEEGGGGGGC
jgi:hypothetical protein